MKTEKYKVPRKCDITGTGMWEGYCFGDGQDYAIDKAGAVDLAIQYGYETIEEAWEDDAYYFTEWQELDEDGWYESDYEDGRDAEWVDSGIETDVNVVDNRTLSETKEALDRVVKQHLELVVEFAQYRAESVKWCIEDFLDYDHPTHTITPEQAQMALEHMISGHDASIGITWDTVSDYIEMYGTKK